ncbi:hypothetical protein GMSM_46200 [Geomonas sp. Red276]
MTEHDFVEIEQTLQAFPDGADINELEEALRAGKWTLTRRTLQRCLRELRDNNRIRVTGYSQRARRYFPLRASVKEQAARNRLPPPDADSGNRSSASLLLPRHAAVGFGRELLQSYRETGAYLDNATRSHLHRLGAAHHATPPAPTATLVDHILARLLVDLSWASSHLEGNSYSLLEAEKLLTYGEVAGGKNWIDTQMIFNHNEAIEFLVANSTEINFTPFFILNLHAILSDNLLADPKSHGRLRQNTVNACGSVYLPLTTPQLLDEHFRRLLGAAASITDPFEQAFFALAHLSYLQPFEHLSNPVSRLAANIPLLKHNLCPLSFIGVSAADFHDGLEAIRETNRVDRLRQIFVAAYEESVKRYLPTPRGLGEPDLFRTRYRNELTEAIQEVILRSEVVAEVFVSLWAAEQIPAEDRVPFISLVMAEVRGLHEGNIARFRLRPAEFRSWKGKK